LMRTHFAQYCADRLRISLDELMALGRDNSRAAEEPFNMAYLALRGSGGVNGVSKLHGAVSRALFRHLFPRWPSSEVPIGHVTNGVHVPTWESPEARRLWGDVCGLRCWHGDLEQMESKIRDTPAATLWSMRNHARRRLIDYIRARYAQQIAIQGASGQEIAEAAASFDYDTLTLGFARRFATYKRPTLLLQDPERLLRILRDPQRPVQLVLAGKAHPQDSAGQDLIRHWTEFIRRSGARSPVVFLSDYDMLMTQHLGGGVDVWINTPRRPWEASGTSGMKVLVNGGLNLSELDGWWVEAYAAEVGWAIGDGHEHGDDPAWDAAEADQLYSLLEREVVPQFYQRNDAGIPEKWIARVRESMARLTPHFSANRAVREYTAEHYVPAAAAYAARAAEGGRAGAVVLEWSRKVEAAWSHVSFGPLHMEFADGRFHFAVPVYLGGLDSDAVRVELFAEGPPGESPARTPMERGAELPPSGFIYSVSVEANRNANDFTPRVVPYHPGAAVPLEANQILWQK
jgi:starch phosphorylase